MDNQRIDLNGAVFCPSLSDALSTVFESPKAAAGYYRMAAGGVIFYALDGSRIGGVNRHGVMYSSGMAYGKLWHNYAEIKGVPEWPGYWAKCKAAEGVLDLWRRHHG